LQGREADVRGRSGVCGVYSGNLTSDRGRTGTSACRWDEWNLSEGVTGLNASGDRCSVGDTLSIDGNGNHIVGSRWNWTEDEVACRVRNSFHYDSVHTIGINLFERDYNFAAGDRSLGNAVHNLATDGGRVHAHFTGMQHRLEAVLIIALHND